MKTFTIVRLLLSLFLIGLGIYLLEHSDDSLLYMNLFIIVVNSVIVGSILTLKK